MLAEVAAPTALSVEEVQELLRLTGLLTPATAADPQSLYAMDVSYRDFVEHLCFIPPPSHPHGAPLAPPPAAPRVPLLASGSGAPRSALQGAVAAIKA